MGNSISLDWGWGFSRHPIHVKPKKTVELKVVSVFLTRGNTPNVFVKKINKDGTLSESIDAFYIFPQPKEGDILRATGSSGCYKLLTGEV